MSCIFCAIFFWFLLPHPRPFPLGCWSSLLASLQEAPTAAEVPETSPKIHVFLSSLQSLPPLPWHSLLGHSPALPGPPPSSFGTCSPVRSLVSQLFWGECLPRLRCFLHLLLSMSKPTSHSCPLLWTWQLFILTAASRLWQGRSSFSSPHFFWHRTWQLWYHHLLPLILLDEAFSHKAASKSKPDAALAHS